MKDWQERVVIEQSELQDKIHKLQMFSQSEMFANLQDSERLLMMKQLAIMEEYSSILTSRIAMFKIEGN